MNKIFFESRVLSLGRPGEEAVDGGRGPEYTYTGQAELAGLLDDFAKNGDMERLHLVHGDLEELAAAVRSCFKYICAGGGLVQNSLEQFLAIRRNGVWDLPKGKMDAGESFAETALREVEEECGLQGLELGAELGATFHTYPHKGRMVLKETRWYLMYYPGSEAPVLQAEEGISDYRWVDRGASAFMEAHTYASILDVLRLAGQI